MFKEIRSVIIPENKLNNLAIQLASALSAGHETLMSVDGINYYPHLTLYNAEYPIKNLNLISQAMQAIAQKSAVFELEYEDIYTGWGYIGLGFKNNEEVRRLHEIVVRTLSPLREGRLRGKYESEIAEGKYAQREIEYIQNFGYQNIFENYHPHLTLGRFESEELAKKAAVKLRNKKLKIKAYIKQIGIAEVGPHGTCTKVLQVYDLQ